MTSFEASLDTAVDTGIHYPDEYPNLGFNPAPGVPKSLATLTGKITAASAGLAEADRLLGRMRSASSSVWQGDAAEAFRSHVNDKLAPDLEHAQESLSKAVTVLSNWHSTLVSDKDWAQQLDELARRAREAKAQADTQLQEAQQNPDLGLVGRTFTDPAALADARTRYGTAISALESAQSASANAAGDLNSVIEQAKSLNKQHLENAARAADDLRSCTNHLAPEKPGGLLHSIGSAIGGALGAVGGFIKDHLKQIHDVLSTISAISGLLALVTPPPADAIFGAVALVSGAGALGTDLADPTFRAALRHGDLSAITTLAGDALSVVPGAGALGKTALGATKVGTSEAGRVAQVLERVPGVSKLGKYGASSLSEAFHGVAKSPGVVANQIVKRVTPVARVLDRATGLDRVLSLGYRTEQQFTAADRLALLMRSHTVESRVQADVKDANR